MFGRMHSYGFVHSWSSLGADRLDQSMVGCSFAGGRVVIVDVFELAHLELGEHVVIGFC
jgi:hypothetical protein